MDAQIEEATDSVEVRGRFEKNLWLVGNWATTTIKNDLSISQLDVARVLRLDHLPTLGFYCGRTGHGLGYGS